jgi:hypothetical protein
LDETFGKKPDINYYHAQIPHPQKEPETGKG